MPAYRKVLCTVYGTIALAALIATVNAFAQNPNFFLETLRDAKVNPGARFILADLLLLALAAIILMVIEARKHNVKFVWAYVVVALFVAISVAFPLFLIARELRMGPSEVSRPTFIGSIVLSLLAAAVAGVLIWVHGVG